MLSECGGEAMEYLLGLAGVIIGIIALVKASRAQGKLREPWTGLDALAERLHRLGRRLKWLEEQLREQGVAPAPSDEEAPPTLPAAVAEEKAAAPVPEAVAPPEEKPPVPAAPGRGYGVTPPPVPRPAPAAATPRPTPPPPPLSERLGIPWEKLEEIIGKQWLTWVGVLVLFVAAGLFLQHAFRMKWIGPGTQILLASLAGVALVGLGFHFLRKDMRALGQGLIGGGLMILYVALFCAYSPDVYDEPVIQSQKLTFALMCVVTVIGIVSSVRFDALPISFLAVLGGFLTPVLVSTGVDARDTLFAYLLLLDLGVLSVAFYKRWRALDVLAFVGTTILFGMWYHRFYAPTALTPAMLWLSTFYVVFLVLPFVHHLRAKTSITVERFVMALANATFAFGYAWRMMGDEHSEALAGVTLVMAGFYLALSVLTRTRIPADRRSLFGFTALAVTCLTITMPLYFEMNGITLGWTAQACVLLYLGYRFAYRPVRIGGFLVLLLMLMRVFWTHWDASASRTEAFTLILNGEFLILMCAPVGAAIFAVLHHVFRKDATLPDRTMKTVCTIGAGLLLLVFLHTEIAEWLRLRAGVMGVSPDYVTAATLTVLWALGAVGFLAGGRQGKSLPVVFAGLLPVVVALFHAVALYFLRPGEYLLILNRRFSACLIFTGVLWAYAFMPKPRELRRAALIAVGYLSLILVHVELWRWIQQASVHWEQARADYALRWAAALVWALGAAAFLLIARRRGSRTALRAGLAPLAVAVLLAVALYFIRAGQDFTFIGNARCLACLVVAAVLWAYARAFHEPGKARNIALILAGYATVLLAHVEIWRWVQVWAEWTRVAYITRGVLPILWSLGTVACLAAGRQWRTKEAYWGALVPLGAAFLCGFFLYAVKMPADYVVVLNARFLGGLVVCAAAFMTALALHRDPELAGEDERSLMTLVSWMGLLLLLMVLSIEPYAWIRKTVTDHQRAAWLSQMSLTLVWGVYASGLLSVGFWKRWRPLRLAALGLFGLTVLKLAFVDLAGLRQIYRILSFFVLGVLILGAAYLYHKAEKLLTQTRGADDGG